MKNLKEYILPFWFTKDQHSLPQEGITYILRSALKSENAASMNSGVGISIPGIRTDLQYNEALTKLHSQKDFDFSLLQPFYEYQAHLTIFKTKDFVFIEAKTENTNQFYFFNNLTGSLLPSWGRGVQGFLSTFNRFYEGEFIIEIGVKELECKVFQINELTDKHIKNALYEEVLSKALVGNKLINNDSFFQKLKLEYKAFKFRQREDFLDFSDTFNNWVYIFFYFKIYCTTQKLEFGSQSFQSFLSSTSQNNTISKNLKRHLEISNLTNKARDWNIQSGFTENSEIYIGSGFLEGTVDKDVLVSEDLTIEELLSQKPSVILTTYNSILSHPILYSAENGISLVGGLTKASVRNIKKGDKFSIDFKLKQIIIKSS
jgi:phosphohistidine swiveling domain-containing protein